MTTPDPSQFLDTGNRLLRPAPAQLETGTVQAPAGVLSVITIRTNTATVTAFLAPSEIRAWADALGKLADAAGGSKLMPASAQDVAALGRLMPPNGKPR